LPQFYKQKKMFINSNIIVLDYSNEVYPDSFFLNSDHLNEIGAIEFTKRVKQNIQSYKEK